MRRGMLANAPARHRNPPADGHAALQRDQPASRHARPQQLHAAARPAAPDRAPCGASVADRHSGNHQSSAARRGDVRPGVQPSWLSFGFVRPRIILRIVACRRCSATILNLNPMRPQSCPPCPPTHLQASRWNAAQAVPPAASRPRSPPPFPAWRAASRPGCAASSSTPVIAAVCSATRAGRQCAAACEPRSRCAAPIVCTRWTSCAGLR